LPTLFSLIDPSTSDYAHVLICTSLTRSCADRVASWLSVEEKRLSEARIKSENAGSVVAVEALKKQTILNGIFSINTCVQDLTVELSEPKLTFSPSTFALPTSIPLTLRTSQCTAGF
jgi:hypothetical protein